MFGLFAFGPEDIPSLLPARHTPRSSASRYPGRTEIALPRGAPALTAAMPMRRPEWMKAIPHEPDPYLDLSTTQAVMWWEIRRPLFNFYLFLVGMASVILMKFLVDRFVSPAAGISTSGIISGTFFYGLAANVCYTFGWITELFLRRSDPVAARRKAVDLYWTGLKLSCLLTTAPLWFALFAFVRNRV